MLKFDRKIVQFGFGAVGKSFYEKISKEIKFNENKYFVITMDKSEFEAYVNLGGMVANFLVHEVTKDNFKTIFGQYLEEGDLLIDFADTVGTKDILDWCAEKNIMYINTGEADWPENWYSIFNENILKNKLREKHNKNNNTNKYPIVLQHGNNPGLVSHFVKAGIEYIVNTQFKKDKTLKKLIKENKFNEVAQKLGLKMIHVNDIDLQEVDNPEDAKLYSTWCVDSFFFEMLSEATINIGTHEKIDFKDECNLLDFDNGFLELKKIAADMKCHTYYPNGQFDGFLVPHEETITIAKSLEVKENDKTIYRPTVMFLYSPCKAASDYLINSKVNEYPNPDPNGPLDCENQDGQTIVRGRIYPEKAEIIYQEKIKAGTEYVGVLLIGDNFKPVWVGNRIEVGFLYKNKNDSYWQTPTITPVAMSALAAVCWMIKNKEKGGIYFPDDIAEYKDIIKIAEKYISKTIYKTFEKSTIEENLKIDFSNLQTKDLFVK
ncbi:MAG: saccharopine dehydrogenase NADP-binding domain-containing protein [Clostridia bacterium]|nr:saccharopine dehydrogenase NADP-binding domain-containing protein [Clostridia bacterium]